MTPDNNNAYKICSKCVMDTSDPQINFDENSVCNHCREFVDVTSRQWFPNEAGAEKWQQVAEKIIFEGKQQEYDCILGLSGGVDSSYLALKVFEAGLRPLVVHVDAGWNSELAVANIESLVKYCKFDLHTHVINWSDMRSLHLAYLKAGIANQDVPQDHAFFASLYHFATKNGIKYILSGGNIATESIFPKSWQGPAMDAINLKAIYNEFGGEPLKSYPTISFLQYYLWYPFYKKMRTIRPLNYMPFNKQTAIEELAKKTGWRAYGRKHGESLFTKLFQNHYLPQKFGYDKRRPHFSSLIVSNQMTRKEALENLKKPLYDIDELNTDLDYFCKKLRISRKEYDEYLMLPNRDHEEFASWRAKQKFAKDSQILLQKILGRSINVYS